MVLTASVECGRYIKAERGTLTLADGQLRFQTSGRALFDVPLSSAQKIIWHWYSFGGGLEAVIADKSYFLSFIPRGAGLGVWYAGLSTGRRWRAAMEGRPEPSGPPLAARMFMVLFQIIMLFFLACFALLALGVVIEPETPIFMRILSGVSAAALGIACIMLTRQGLSAAFRSVRRNK